MTAFWLEAPPPAAGQASVAGHPRVQEALRLLETWMQAERDYEGIPDGIMTYWVHNNSRHRMARLSR